MTIYAAVLPRTPRLRNTRAPLPMQALTALAPLVAFFAAYRLRDLYAATAVLMAAMVLVLAVDWLRHRRIPALHALSAVLVLVFGSATLLLHNRLFIQWKPTVLFWALGLAFLASSRIGERTLTERLLAPALGERVRASPAQWQRLNLSSGVLYALLGALNLVVAYNASERAWVNFKMFGLTLLTFAGITLQLLWLAPPRIPPRPGPFQGGLTEATATAER